MNVARARRRWRKWERYIDHLCKFGPDVIAPDGSIRAHNQKARYIWLKNYRASRGVYVAEKET